MSSESRQELDARAREGETVVPGGTGRKSLEAQEHLVEGMALPVDILLFFQPTKTEKKYLDMLM